MDSAAQSSPERNSEKMVIMTYDTYSRIPRVKSMYSLIDEFMKDETAGPHDAYHLSGKYEKVSTEYNSLYQTLKDLTYYAIQNNLGERVGSTRPDRKPWEDFWITVMEGSVGSRVPGGCLAIRSHVFAAIDEYEKNKADKLTEALGSTLPELTGEHLVLLLQEYARRERLIAPR